MSKKHFKKLLFKVAFCAMTCDGYIDDREIEELKIIDTKTKYFSDIDLSQELDSMISDVKEKGRKILDDLLLEITQQNLNTIQELLILEVAFRIVNADEKIEENEKWFIKILRAKLKVHNETIIDRFGQTELLFNKEYNHNIDRSLIQLNQQNKFKLPEMKDIEKIDLDNFKT